MFTPFKSQLCISAIAVAWVALAGCSDSSQLETATVSGTVTLDGNPLSKGIVTFQPEYGRGATGYIQADGSYLLSTYKSGDGAIVGAHKIGVISTEIDPNQGPESGSKSLVPTMYATPDGSGLSAEVQPDQENRIDLKLTSKQVKQ